MKNNFKKWGLALVFGLTLYACKKENSKSQPEFAEDAKNWYLQNNQKTSFALRSDHGQTIQLKQELDWDNSKKFKLEDGTDVMSVPMKFTIAKGVSAKGSYLLMIAKEGSSYKNITVFNKSKDFAKTITADHVQQAFTREGNLLKNRQNHTKQEGLGKMMRIGNSEPITQEKRNWIEWHLVETRYVDGFSVSQTESYIDKTDSLMTPEDPAGAATQSSTTIFDWGDLGHPVSEDLGSFNETTDYDDGEECKRRELHWKAFNGFTFYIWSRETGLVCGRNWRDLDHLGLDISGFWALGDISIIRAVATPTVDYKYDGISNMKITIDIKMIPSSILGITPPPIYLRNKVSVGKWNTDFEFVK